MAAIFPALEFESTVQVSDLTRLKAEKSSSPLGAITLIEIQPEADADFYDVTETDGHYVDYSYAVAGAAVVTVRCTVGAEVETKTFSITVVSAEDDALLASDSDLRVHESDISDYLKPGRATFNDVHRRARKLIIDTISLENVKSGTGNTITVADIHDTSALKDWSTYLSLRLIFFDNTVSAEDRFERKAEYYRSFEHDAKTRALESIELDEDNDGVADDSSPINFSSIRLVRS